MNPFGVMVGLDKKEAFEGWFTKIDDRESGLMLSVIWGYSTHQQTKHAFIQFQDSRKHNTDYIRYPLDELKWSKEPFSLHIGNNELSEKGMRLDFDLNGVPVQGEFSFGAFSPIRQSMFKPNIMGWLTFFPNECNHAIISMEHAVSGKIRIGDRAWKIRDAAGYIEKDWGTGFPQKYVWVQANAWKRSSVVFSYATVPLLGKHAKGFFLVLQHGGKEYRFTSLEGSRLTDFSATADSFQATIQKWGVRVTLKAKQFNPVALAAPERGVMKNRIKESLDGTLELALEMKGQLPVMLLSDRASIDVHY